MKKRISPEYFGAYLGKIASISDYVSTPAALTALGGLSGAAVGGLAHPIVDYLTGSDKPEDNTAEAKRRRLLNSILLGGAVGGGVGLSKGIGSAIRERSKEAELKKIAADPVLDKVLRSGALGAALGGGGTAIYDYLAGTPDGRLRRALMGAGVGGLGGAGVGLLQSYADQKANELETADAASKSSPYSRSVDKNNKDVAQHGIYQTQRKAVMDRGEGKQTKQQKKDVASHGIYQTHRKPKEEVAKSTLEGANLGIEQLKNIAGTVPGAAATVADSAKDVVVGGVVNPLRDLFKRKMQEAETARIAKNRSALLSNVQAINDATKDRPSTAIPDNLIIPPENLYGKYDSKNQLDWERYNKGMDSYRRMLKTQPSAVPASSLGASTSASDIEAMRRAIQSGR